jgi:hypothetical protein
MEVLTGQASLRQCDKAKDYAIAHLSDQLVALSARFQEIERTTYSFSHTVSYCKEKTILLRLLDL